MLKSIKITNFKPFGEGKPVRLAPITLIYGPNSSGKSSVIQSLLLLRQTLTGQQTGSRNDLITRGEMVDLGNFLSVLHRHDRDRKLGLEFEFDPASSRPRGVRNEPDPCAGISLSFSARSPTSIEVIPTLELIDFKVEDAARGSFGFQLERCISADRSSADVDEDVDDNDDPAPSQAVPSEEREGDFKFGGNSNLAALYSLVLRLGAQRHGQGGPSAELSDKEEWPNPDAAVDALKSARFSRGPGGTLGREFLPCWTRPIGQVWNPRMVLRTFDIRLRRTVGALTYLGPLRAHPERLYALKGIPGRSVGPHGEHAVQILYHDHASEISSPSLLERLNTYCEELNIPYGFELQSVGNEITGDLVVLSLLDTRTGISVAPTDVGFGIGQLLPILVEGMVASGLQSQRIVCVEQPEIHLHPRLQASMADFFRSTACLRGGSESGQRQEGGVQWILETHSEALISRLQRRIRERALSSTDVCVLYVEPNGEKGSVIKELRLDEDGEFIDLWPDGFFVEGLADMFGDEK